MKRIALLLVLAIAVPGAALAAPDRTAAPKANIVETAAAAGQFTTLLSLAKQAGLVGALSGPGKITVFAPTDAAFKKVPKATLAKLGEDKALLKRVLLYHVVKGQVPAAKVVTLKSAKTLAGPVRADPCQRAERVRRQGEGLEGRHPNDERDHPCHQLRVDSRGLGRPGGARTLEPAPADVESVRAPRAVSPKPQQKGGIEVTTLTSTLADLSASHRVARRQGTATPLPRRGGLVLAFRVALVRRNELQGIFVGLWVPSILALGALVLREPSGHEQHRPVRHRNGRHPPRRRCDAPARLGSDPGRTLRERAKGRGEGRPPASDAEEALRPVDAA